MRVVQILGFLFLLFVFFTLAKEKIDDVITINAEKKDQCNQLKRV